LTEGIDSSLASAARVETAEEAPALDLAQTPPLAWMAGAAALATLLLHGVLLRLGHSTWSNAALFELDRWGGFTRNLSVVAALVSLGFCLWSLSSKQSGLPLSARIGIASFGWVLLPIVALMTALPTAWTGQELVLTVAGLSHAVILLITLAGLHWRSSVPTALALVFTLVASFSGLAALMVSLIGGRTYWAHTERLANALQWSGELAYLAVPIAVAFALAIPWQTHRGRAALGLSTLAAAVVAIAMAFWRRAVGDELAVAIYSALHLDLFADRFAVLYAIPLGMAWAVTVAAALSKDPARRQMGAALVALLSAGYAPRTADALILTVLAVALMARASMAIAGRRG
jgi:hypothetical protein